MRRLFPVIAATFLAAPAAWANLIVNGNFASGNTGFGSDYFYTSPNTDAGQYFVLSATPNNWNGAFVSTLQGQGGSGDNYLLANGASSTTQSPWYQTIAVSPGDITVTTNIATPVYYRFEGYIASAYGGGAQPQLSFEMSLNNSGQWQELTTSTTIANTNAGIWFLTYRDGYFLSSPTSISFRLRNTVTDGFGNDFAIDSLYFGLSTNSPSYISDPTGNPINSIGAITGGVVPEPGTWAAASLLVGTAGFVRWRRRKV